MQNTTLCYLERDGQYLMLHRVKKEHDANRDKWIGVGGKFEDRESPEDCVLREVREETGLILTDYRYRGLVTFVSDRWPTEYMHLFTASAWTGELSPCDEGELVWVDKSRIPSLPIWQGDRLFLRLLEQDAPFFSLKLVYTGETLASAALNGVPLARSAHVQNASPETSRAASGRDAWPGGSKPNADPAHEKEGLPCSF